MFVKIFSLALIVLSLLTGCGDKHQDYIGYWQSEDNKIIKIYKDGDTFLLSKPMDKKDKPAVLTKNENQLSLQSFVAISLAEDNKLYFGNEPLKRISKADFDEIYADKFLRYEKFLGYWLLETKKDKKGSIPLTKVLQITKESDTFFMQLVTEDDSKKVNLEKNEGQFKTVDQDLIIADDKKEVWLSGKSGSEKYVRISDSDYQEKKTELVKQYQEFAGYWIKDKPQSSFASNNNRKEFISISQSTNDSITLSEIDPKTDEKKSYDLLKSSGLLKSDNGQTLQLKESADNGLSLNVKRIENNYYVFEFRKVSEDQFKKEIQSIKNEIQQQAVKEKQAEEQRNLAALEAGRKRELAEICRDLKSQYREAERTQTASIKLHADVVAKRKELEANYKKIAESKGAIGCFR